MTRIVKCVKLDKESEGLAQAPYPGELGQRIYAHVSKEAWQMWLRHQTMLINEYRLTPLDPKTPTALDSKRSWKATRIWSPKISNRPLNRRLGLPTRECTRSRGRACDSLSTCALIYALQSGCANRVTMQFICGMRAYI